MKFTASKLLLLISVLLFVLAGFDVWLGTHVLTAAGLAFLAASFLIP